MLYCWERRAQLGLKVMRCSTVTLLTLVTLRLSSPTSACLFCVLSPEKNTWTSDPCPALERSPFTHLPPNWRHIFGAVCQNITAAILFADSYRLCFTDCIHHLSYSFLALFYLKRCLFKHLLQLTFPGTHYSLGLKKKKKRKSLTIQIGSYYVLQGKFGIEY